VEGSAGRIGTGRPVHGRGIGLRPGTHGGPRAAAPVL